MLLRSAGVFNFFFFLLSLSGAYTTTPDVVDGSLNITAFPFLQIGKGLYYFDRGIKLNWFDAYESCRRIKSDLVAFETIDEWDLIHEYLKTLGRPDDLFWTSGNDLANVGKHNWFATGEPLTLDIWAPGEPNNNGGIEHCDELGYRGTRPNNNLLNDLSCNSTRHYICERL
ncbi:C-type lectin 37Da-like [Drosophila madeirensis]|uniref:C-type lectin 37Da-like n=1 Tax=Drosophila madeirensis TaxID=30013 RepID=A0AAU9FDN3_DROMD